MCKHLMVKHSSGTRFFCSFSTFSFIKTHQILTVEKVMQSEPVSFLATLRDYLPFSVAVPADVYFKRCDKYLHNLSLSWQVICFKSLGAIPVSAKSLEQKTSISKGLHGTTCGLKVNFQRNPQRISTISPNLFAPTSSVYYA